MNKVTVDALMQAMNLDDFKYADQLLTKSQIGRIQEYMAKNNSSLSRTTTPIKKGEIIKHKVDNGELVPMIEETIISGGNITRFFESFSKASFIEWNAIKKHLIHSILSKEKIKGKLETIKNLEVNELYSTVFGNKFNSSEYISLIDNNLDYFKLFKKIDNVSIDILGQNVSPGLLMINGIPKSGKQLLQLYLMDSYIKQYKQPILNIVCGERPDTILSKFYPIYFLQHKNLIIERIIPSSIFNLLYMISNTNANFIVINSINSIIDKNNSGIITKGGLDRNAIELICKLIHYVAIANNKTVLAVYRTQNYDDEVNIKSIFSGVTNGVITLPKNRMDSMSFNDNIKFDNRSPGTFDGELDVISFNEIKNMIDNNLLKL